MASAGDIAKESGLFLVTMTATEAISKGDVVTLADGKVADVTAGEIGPFGVAIEDIANTESGQVAVAPTVVYVTAGTGGVSAFDLVMPSEDTGEEGQVQPVSSPAFNEVVGMMLEAAAAAAVGKCRLGYH